MHRSVVLGVSHFEAIVPIAQAAEQAGYDRVWTTEAADRDATIRAAAIAAATDRIKIATGITYAFSRSPLSLAATAADVNRIAGGRFALGLGPAPAACGAGTESSGNAPRRGSPSTPS